jgi:hypothetical protein
MPFFLDLFYYDSISVINGFNVYEKVQFLSDFGSWKINDRVNRVCLSLSIADFENRYIQTSNI